MELEKLEAVIALMRRTGVTYLEDNALKIVLGPQLPDSLQTAPKPDVKDTPVDTRPNYKLNPLLNHPSLKGLRPTPRE